MISFCIKHLKFSPVQGEGGELRSTFRWLLPVLGQREAGVVVAWTVVVFTIISAALCSLLQFGSDFLALPYPAVWAVFLTIVLVIALVFSELNNLFSDYANTFFLSLVFSSSSFLCNHVLSDPFMGLPLFYI